MAEKTQKSVKIAPGAVVCVESEIRGDVTIGPRTVIHPKARIIAEAGPIIIGEGNLIEEQALIINAHPDDIIPDAGDSEPKPMIIGTNNVFEVGCQSQAMKMGDNNVIESKAYVGRNVILTSGCIIGACCNLNTFEVIPENTVIYGTDCLRRVQTERPQLLSLSHLPCTGPEHRSHCHCFSCPRSQWSHGLSGLSSSVPPEDCGQQAPDTAAGFLDENFAKLPPPKEDHEGQCHSSEELRAVHSDVLSLLLFERAQCLCVSSGLQSNTVD
ncbi:dynactin subunit 6 isoform X1 [Nannospalax galili]|uniref:dynactin subunit 6 isoform X1 n=1 Tax=Nannospalax galili TaxID=1026970 RepID=UPI000819B8A4|nr:dynactin subunit 6 isoform X1 [Nannospalax galili]